MPATWPVPRLPGSTPRAVMPAADPAADARPLEEATRRAIADRRGSVAWDPDAIGWRVEVPAPDPESFRGVTPAEALAWRLVRPKADGWGIRAFA